MIDRPELRICGHCRLQMKGYASMGDTWLCHPDEGLDCYRLVTVYKHAMPCFQCASIHYDAGETVDPDRPETWPQWLAAARVRYRSEFRKHRGIDRLRAMYRRRKR